MVWQSVRSALLGALLPGSAVVPLSSGEGLLEVDKELTFKLTLKLISIVGARPYPVDEIMLMAAAFTHHRPDLVIDVGTNVGKSARIWWELARAGRSSCEIQTVDIMDPSHPEFPAARLGKFIRNTGVIQRIGDSGEVLNELISENPGVTTLVFLDGSHEYDIVRRDLDVVKRAKAGCVLVHDTMFQPAAPYNHGPYLAVRDFLAESPGCHIASANSGLPGLTYISIGAGSGSYATDSLQRGEDGLER